MYMYMGKYTEVLEAQLQALVKWLKHKHNFSFYNKHMLKMLSSTSQVLASCLVCIIAFE